jgi:RNA polymerase sigma-70 factor, ECF subfamily
MTEVDRAADAELMLRVRLGDREAFGALVRRHLRRAVRLAERLLGDPEDAEDVAQESFMAVLDAAEGFDPGRPFAPWFYRIVANRCANANRSRVRRGAEPLTPNLVSGGRPPDQVAEMSALGDRLRTALLQLPERQRQILLLYEVEGYSGPEISEILEISPGTVRWHLHQARAAMRAILVDEDQEDG